MTQSSVKAYPQDQTRNNVLDFVRTVAIILVTFTHGLDNIYSFTAKGALATSPLSFYFASWVHATGRVATPLFFMLTGYLVLTREFNSAEDVFRFWKKKLLPLVICYEIWILIYEAFFYFYKGTGFSVKAWLPRALLFKATDFTHTWYLPVIIGIYFAIPFFSILLHKLPPKVVFVALGFGLYFFSLMPTLDVVLKYLKITHQAFENQTKANWVGGCHMLFVIYGYYMKTLVDPKLNELKSKGKTIALLALVTVICDIAMATFMFLCFRSGYAHQITNSFILMPVLSVALFPLFLMMPQKLPFKAVWKEISVSALGLYYVHYPVLKLFLKYFRDKTEPIANPLETVLYFVITFPISLAIVSIVSRLCPFLGKWLFMRKPPKKKELSEKTAEN